MAADDRQEETRCPHEHRASCQLCGERFCLDCDPNHRENCREAYTP